MPRVINFEGRRITLADDLTDDDVSAILHAPRITVTPQADPLKGPPIEASRGGNPEGGFASSLGVGAQGVGRGLASIAGAPVDLTTGLLNLIPMASNAIFGTEFEGIKKPFLGSEQIREDATSLFEPLGVKVRSEAEMTPGQKLGYNVSNFGTQFAVPAGGIAAAGRVARQVAPTVPGRIADTFRRPYAEAPMRTVAGDTAGGVGAGVATDFVQNNVAPDSPFRVPAEIAAVLGGGVGGSTALGVGESIGNLFRSLQMRGTDVGVGVKNPQTNAPFSQLDTERTARTMQEAATNPALAAREIDEGSRALTNPALPGEAPLATGEIPTSGLLSRDPGLVNLEQRARMQNAPDFVQRDQGVKRAAAERVEGLKDPDADLGAPRAVAQTEANARVGIAQDTANTETSIVREGADRSTAAARDAAERAVATARAEVEQGITGAQSRLAAAEQSLREVEATLQQQGAPIAARANTDAKARASQQLDRTIVDEGYIPARTEKNRQFDEAPGRNEQLPADEVIAAARRVQADINALAPGGLQMPGEFVRRLRALEPRMVEGENVGGPGTALGADLADLRKYLGTAYESAQRSGNFDLADNIQALRRAINNTIEDAPGYAEANQNYREFADRFRPSPNDEAAKFTRQIDRDPGRGSTPPSRTAERFLSGPERVQSLQRMMDGNGAGAVREYLLSDFGMSAMNPNGTLNANRAAAWGRNNAAVLEQFPQLRQEFDGLLATARRGEELSETASQSIKDARTNLATTERQGTQRLRETERTGARDVRTAEAEGGKQVREAESRGKGLIRDTERDVERSAAGTLMREDPRDVASRLLSGRYGAEKEIDEINALVASDPTAQRGWKAAVAEVLTDRVTSTRQTGETFEVQFARLAKEFKDNEQVLARVFTPEEMNTLRQAHTLLGYFKEAEKRALVGSQTAERMQIPGWIQLLTRHIKGDLAGGGLIRRFKLMVELLPSNREAAEQLMTQAWFDPKVAAYLLRRDVRSQKGEPRSVPLGRAEAAAAGGRASAEENE